MIRSQIPMAHAARQSEDGYFPQGRSMLRQVHGERLVGLMYGQRALCIGACAPLNSFWTPFTARCHAADTRA